MTHMMDVVVKTVNFVPANACNHHESVALLGEIVNMVTQFTTQM
jgi:hypothetical protein